MNMLMDLYSSSWSGISSTANLLRRWSPKVGFEGMGRPRAVCLAAGFWKPSCTTNIPPRAVLTESWMAFAEGAAGGLCCGGLSVSFRPLPLFFGQSRELCPTWPQFQRGR